MTATCSAKIDFCPARDSIHHQAQGCHHGWHASRSWVPIWLWVPLQLVKSQDSHAESRFASSCHRQFAAQCNALGLVVHDGNTLCQVYSRNPQPATRYLLYDQAAWTTSATPHDSCARLYAFGKQTPLPLFLVCGCGQWHVLE